MSTPIKTNLINAHINKKSDVYSFLKITTSDKYLSSAAYILDEPLLIEDVCSIKYENSKTFYLMYKNSQSTYHKIITEIKKHKEAQTLVFEEIGIEQTPKNILVQLLLNNLANYSNKFLRFNNLTGHLYCFHVDWIKRKKSSKEQLIWQVPALEIKVNADMTLSLNVCTFTSELLSSKMDITREQMLRLPKYVMSAHNTMRRKLKNDTETAFVMRQIKGYKTDISFLNLHNSDYFSRSKMGILERVIRQFNEYYQNICYISFNEIRDYKSIDYTRTAAKENNQLIKDLLSEENITIVDEINDEYSEQFVDDTLILLKEKYGVSAKKKKRISKEGLNIKVIHNKEYYEGSNDPHKAYKYYAVQHITIEDFAGSANYAISTIIHELLIKKDLANKRITLFKWEELEFTETLLFGSSYELDGVTKYFFMEIQPDGKFEIKERKFDLFNMDKYNEYVNIFQDNHAVKGIVENKNGFINIIKDTGIFTIPEIHDIYDELTAGNTSIRGKEKRDELLSAVLDIKYFEESNSKYYFVGTIGNGMNRSINSAVNIRKIEGYNNSPIFFDEVLPLMNVTFVRNGQLTIQPFPFKYLREYVRINFNV